MNLRGKPRRLRSRRNFFQNFIIFASRVAFMKKGLLNCGIWRYFAKISSWKSSTRNESLRLWANRKLSNDLRRFKGRSWAQFLQIFVMVLSCLKVTARGLRSLWASPPSLSVKQMQLCIGVSAAIFKQKCVFLLGIFLSILSVIIKNVTVPRKCNTCV